MDINNNDDDAEWNNIINEGSSPPSYIQQLPESIKLILATLFVALILHIFFTTSRRRSNNNCDIERLRDELSGRGAVGSLTTEPPTEKTTNNEDNVGGQVLGDCASAEEEGMLRDILLCKKMIDEVMLYVQVVLMDLCLVLHMCVYIHIRW